MRSDKFVCSHMAFLVMFASNEITSIISFSDLDNTTSFTVPFRVSFAVPFTVPFLIKPILSNGIVTVIVLAENL